MKRRKSGLQRILIVLMMIGFLSLSVCTEDDEGNGSCNVTLTSTDEETGDETDLLMCISYSDGDADELEKDCATGIDGGTFSEADCDVADLVGVCIYSPSGGGTAEAQYGTGYDVDTAQASCEDNLDGSFQEK